MAPPRVLIPEQEAELCLQYTRGDNTYTIAKTFHISQPHVSVIARRNGIKLRAPHKAKSVPLSEFSQIMSRYSLGESTVDIAPDYNVSAQTIRNCLMRSEFPRREQHECQAHLSCDRKFFDVIDTEAKAYWLGFLAADGCVSDNNDVIITLAARDKRHLVRFRDILNSEHTIREHTSSKGSYGPTSLCTLNIKSLELAAGLKKHGVIPRKTFTLQWPDFLNDDLLRHYLRGYNDGDGGFYAKPRRESTGHHETTFGLTAGRNFLEGAQEFLMRTCELSATKFNVRHKNRPETCMLRYGGNRQVKRIFHLLYHKSTIFLPRKFWKAFPILYPSHPAVLKRQQRETVL